VLFHTYKKLWVLISLITILSVAISPNFIIESSSNIGKTDNFNNNYSSSCNISMVKCLDNILLPHSNNQTKKAINKIQIDPILEQVNSTKLKEYINYLSSFHTRHSKSYHIENIAHWLKNEFENICKGRVFFHNYTQSDQNQTYHLKNIICTSNSNINNSNSISNSSNINKQDLSFSSNYNSTIIIGAHYDSRAKNINNTYARAPGADDNASGVSAVLELARILSQLNLKYNLQFVLFSGEEQGKWGSKNYVKYLANNNQTKDIDLYINFDMIGYPPVNESNKVILEYDVGNKHLQNDKYSKLIGHFIKQISWNYTNLKATLGKLGNSDFIPFEAVGHTVIGIHDEGSEKNPHYHNSTDIPATLNIKYISSVTKMILATILELDKYYNQYLY
jgi:Peptidase family M28